jgi:hypothetical protein
MVPDAVRFVKASQLAPINLRGRHQPWPSDIPPFLYLSAAIIGGISSPVATIIVIGLFCSCIAVPPARPCFLPDPPYPLAPLGREPRFSFIMSPIKSMDSSLAFSSSSPFSIPPAALLQRTRALLRQVFPLSHLRLPLILSLVGLVSPCHSLPLARLRLSSSVFAPPSLP